MSATKTTDPVASALGAFHALADPYEQAQHRPARERLAQRRALYGPVLDAEEPLVKAAAAECEPRLSVLAGQLCHPRLQHLPGVRELARAVSDELVAQGSALGRFAAIRGVIERNPQQAPDLAGQVAALRGEGERMRRATDAIVRRLDDLAKRLPEALAQVAPLTGSGPIVSSPPPRRPHVIRAVAPGPEDRP